jgi:hypothetical protein
MGLFAFRMHSVTCRFSHHMYKWSWEIICKCQNTERRFFDNWSSMKTGERLQYTLKHYIMLWSTTPSARMSIDSEYLPQQYLNTWSCWIVDEISYSLVQVSKVKDESLKAKHEPGVKDSAEWPVFGLSWLKPWCWLSNWDFVCHPNIWIIYFLVHDHFSDQLQHRSVFFDGV